MHIGIYGGSFNPIHNAHIALAATICQEAGLDEVWFLVSPQNPLKSNAMLLDENLRYDLVRKALSGMPQLVASDYEFHLERPSFTWNTLCHLHHDYPQHQFSLIIGADNWALFSRWAHHQDILAHHSVIIYPRTGYPVDISQLPCNVRLINTPKIDITSTAIREMISRGEDISSLVPQCVCEYFMK